MPGLSSQHCSQENLISLSQDQVSDYLNEVGEWTSDADKNVISRGFRFNRYQDTVNFVNRVAELAESEDHHPDIFFDYNRCNVSFTTHKTGGLTLNDFICAAKVNQLFSSPD